MKAIVADVYTLYNYNAAQFPKKYRGYKIIWNLRDALFEIWDGKLTEIVLPKEGTPGYDFEDFINKMVEIQQINKAPKIKYYELSVPKKS